MTVNIQVEGSICNLTPEGRKAYEKIREQIGAVLAQEDGLNLAMNALIATGPRNDDHRYGALAEGCRGHRRP